MLFSLPVPRLKASALHKSLPSSRRQARLRRFLEGEFQVLVATDLMARGLDTRLVSHVVQLEFARDSVTFLHRLGRTARAAEGGQGKTRGRDVDHVGSSDPSLSLLSSFPSHVSSFPSSVSWS